MENVGATVGAEDLQGGDDAQSAGADLGHHVGQDHSILQGVASRDKTDVVTTNILIERMVLTQSYEAINNDNLRLSVHSPLEPHVLGLHIYRNLNITVCIRILSTVKEDALTL